MTSLKVIKVYVDHALYLQLTKIANKEGVSMSKLGHKAICMYLGTQSAIALSPPPPLFNGNLFQPGELDDSLEQQDIDVEEEFNLDDLDL